MASTVGTDKTVNQNENKKKGRMLLENFSDEEEIYIDDKVASESFLDGFEDEDDDNWMEFDDEIEDLNS